MKPLLKLNAEALPHWRPNAKGLSDKSSANQRKLCICIFKNKHKNFAKHHRVV